jgi:protein PsiE
VARHLILDMKPLDTWRTLGVAAAALVLAVVVLVIRFGHTRFPYDKTDTGH